jgi:hypothetical protein
MPDGAKCQTARNARRRECPKARSACVPIGSCAPFGIFALFGISRCSAFRALRHFAPFGISRPSAVRALRQFAPFVPANLSWHPVH